MSKPSALTTSTIRPKVTLFEQQKGYPLEIGAAASDGSKIAKVVADEPDYYVYLTDQAAIGWDSASSLAGHYDTIAVEMIRIMSIQISHLALNVRQRSRDTIAHALVLVLRGRATEAQEVLGVAETYINARNSEHARLCTVKTVLTVVAGTLALTAAIVLVSAWSSSLSFWDKNQFLAGVLACAMGSVGALVSMVYGMGTTNIDPDADTEVRKWEVALRVIAGAIGGFVAIVAVRSGLVLSDTLGTAAPVSPIVMLTCMAAGTSERFVPNIMNRIDP